MIHAIEIENFKAFDKRTLIDLAPITLLYGENSAGKTAILDAIQLLQQSMGEERERLYGSSGDKTIEPNLIAGGNDYGQFYDFVHDHDASKTVRIRLDSIAGEEVKNSHKSLGESGFSFHAGVEFAFGQVETENTIIWQEVSIFMPDDNTSEVCKPEKIARFDSEYTIDSKSNQKCRVLHHRCTWLSREHQYFRRANGRIRDDLVKQLAGDNVPKVRAQIKQDPNKDFHARHLQTQYVNILFERGFDFLNNTGSFRRCIVCVDLEADHLNEMRKLPACSEPVDEPSPI